MVRRRRASPRSAYPTPPAAKHFTAAYRAPVRHPRHRRIAMKTALLIASGAFAAALGAAAVCAPVQAKTMKECAAQWQEMKTNNQTEGMKYRDFSKKCMSGG